MLHYALITALTGASVSLDPEPRVDAASASTPDTSQTDADVAVVLGEAPGDYLAARGRLEASPALAVPTMERRLADGTLDPAQRRRVLHTLVSIQPDRAATWLRTELKTAITTNQDAGPWLSLVTRLPDQGETILLALVGDATLPVSARGSLLTPLVSAAPDPARFIPLVGHGNRQLERTLRRLLRSRAMLDADARARIKDALDTQIQGGDATPGAVLLRGAIAPLDEGTRAAVVAVAVSQDSPFPLAVACLSILRPPSGGPSSAPLVAFAREQLSPGRRDSTASTILVSFALAALAEEDTTTLIEEFNLLRAQDPRLRALALRRGKLMSASPWLEEALDNPWPEVRLAALGRVAAPCEPATIATLAKEATGTEDANAAVERASIRALARCDSAGLGTLTDLMAQTGLPPWKRAEAAIQVLSVAPERAETVATMLRDSDDSVALALIEALRSIETPSDPLVASACHLSSERPPLQAAARRTLKAWRALSRCE